MAERLVPKGCFDIPDVPHFVPRRLKPWIFVLFVLIIQFSGSIYLAVASYMVGDKALMSQDILMAGYASLAGMSLNFAVMFRIKFRFSTRIQLLATCIVLIAANIVCAYTESVAILVLSCFIAGWFRMQGTFACNSTIQLWLTPYRDMSVFFCFVYIVVDGMIQLSGLATVYSAYFAQWQYMQCTIIGLLAVMMMILVTILVRPVRCPMYIPLLGIDWIGSVLWGIFMLCFTFVCVYGNYFDWWDAQEIRMATLLGTAVLLLNLWRASFLHHPYISFMAMKNRNVVRAMIIYLVFLTSIVQSGLPFMVFPQALTINGFGSAVMGMAFGSAFVGEWLSHVFARNVTAVGLIPQQALVLGMKEIYGWLLIVCLFSIVILAVSYGPLRPFAIFPKWKTIRRTICRMARAGAVKGV